MSVAVITGSAGLVGSEAVRFFAEQGLTVVGIDNDMRQRFFGADASTDWNRKQLEAECATRYEHHNIDIRDERAMDALFASYGRDIVLIVHAAAQPSHDWAASDPVTDFTVNANGTQVLLERTRQHCPDAVFIFCSTNKVYGDAPNSLPLVEQPTRWEIDPSHLFGVGIDETLSIDQSKHSLFGASKVAADILVQEYGRYFGMKTACFRGGCLTGPAHSGAKLHGFLSYLMKCTVTGTTYSIYGYGGKQVRDNLHSKDLVNAFHHFFMKPGVGEVYNMGGARVSHCSLLEAAEECQRIAGRELQFAYQPTAREGDHIWWVSDVGRFSRQYPDWRITYTVPMILSEIFDANVERWTRESNR